LDDCAELLGRTQSANAILIGFPGEDLPHNQQARWIAKRLFAKTEPLENPLVEFC